MVPNRAFAVERHSLKQQFLGIGHGAISTERRAEAKFPPYVETNISLHRTSAFIDQQAPFRAGRPSTTHPNYLLPTGTGCGSNLGVTASVYKDKNNTSSGEAIVGTATVNVQCGTGSGTDFGLSSDPTSVTTSAGSTATYTINVIANSGNPTVGLRVTSGLPAGTAAHFNPASVTAVGASTLTITTSASTATGTYHPRITGSDDGGTLNLGTTLNIN
jgi:uncharacterized repeat protein (TIGR01451 family)